MSNFKTPAEYNLKIDFAKVVWPPMEGWVMKRVTELLKGVEDEVLVGTILESLKSVCYPITTQSDSVMTPRQVRYRSKVNGFLQCRRPKQKSCTTNLCHFFATIQLCL